MLEIYRAREKSRIDTISKLDYAAKQGEIKGELKKAINAAEEMFKDGMKLEKISQYTDLSLEELKKIEKKVRPETKN